MSFEPPSLLRKLLPLTVLVMVLAGVGYTLYAVGLNEGYAPVQPINFSHRKHAGDMQIPCQYCHVNTEQGRIATVPAMNVCMNCHKIAGAGKPEVEKLKEHYAKGEEIEWVRVHDLPDFVYFTHRVHIAKGFACQQCHGPVETMDRIEQVAPLTMGWCVDCHKQNGGPLECNTCHQ